MKKILFSFCLILSLFSCSTAQNSKIKTDPTPTTKLYTWENSQWKYIWVSQMDSFTLESAKRLHVRYGQVTNPLAATGNSTLKRSLVYVSSTGDWQGVDSLGRATTFAKASDLNLYALKDSAKISADVNNSLKRGSDGKLYNSSTKTIVKSTDATIDVDSTGGQYSLRVPNGLFVKDCDTCYERVIIGEIKMYAGAKAPKNHMIAAGQWLKKDSFPALYAAIDTAFGGNTEGDSFRLPDLTSRFVRGAKTDSIKTDSIANRGITGGADSVTLTVNELPAHSHTLNAGSDTNLSNVATGRLLSSDGRSPSAPPLMYTDSAIATTINGNSIANTGGNAAFSINPPFVTLNYIIRVR